MPLFPAEMEGVLFSSFVSWVPAQASPWNSNMINSTFVRACLGCSPGGPDAPPELLAGPPTGLSQSGSGFFQESSWLLRSGHIAGPDAGPLAMEDPMMEDPDGSPGVVYRTSLTLEDPGEQCNSE